MSFYTLRQPLLSLALMGLVIPGFNQEVTLVPKWQKGDLRTMYVQEEQRILENGEERVTPADRIDVKVRVANVTATAYMLELEYRNMLLRKARDLNDKLGDEFEPWKRLIVRYEVDKRSGEPILYNWEDVREMINGTFDQVKRTVRKKDAAHADTLIMQLQPLAAHFQEKASTDAYFRDHVRLLTLPFGKSLQQGSPLLAKQRVPNPFSDGRDSLERVTTLHLETMDQAAHQCSLRAVEDLDTAPYMAALRAAMEKTTSTDPKARASAKARADKAMAATAFSEHREATVIMDLDTTWPLRMQQNSTRITRVPDSEATTTTTVLNIEVR